MFENIDWLVEAKNNDGKRDEFVTVLMKKVVL